MPKEHQCIDCGILKIGKVHKSPYRCRSCAGKHSWQTSPRTHHITPLRPDEVPTGMLLDIDQQRLTTESNGKQMLRILATCPSCTQSRWIRVNGIRSKRARSPLCRSCVIAVRNIPPLKGDGKHLSNGYIEINSRMLDAETLVLAKQYLNPHRGYFYEHRIVALKKYGPAAAMPNVVVRHLDGNKTNNDPLNIAIGSQSDNIADHISDRQAAQYWRSIALWALKRMVMQNT